MKTIMNPFYLSIAIIAFTIALLSLSSCSEDTNSLPDNTNSPGLSTQMLAHDGIDREYLLYLPESYNASTAVPFMLNFHGFGMQAGHHMTIADMRSLAEAENFILVYPQGTDLDGSPHWNAGLDTPENKSDADDFGFVSALIDEINADYNIDRDRVYSCGYSNGAFFTYALACFHSDKIAAIGSVSGTMMEETFNNCNPSHPTAMINIHGTADGTVPYNGTQGLKSIDEVVSYWVGFNNTNSDPQVNTASSGNTTIEYTLYTNGDGNSEVAHCAVENGGHVWFDITFNNANTNELIWNFVSRFDVNGLIETNKNKSKRR